MPEELLSLEPEDAIHISFLDNVDGTITDAYTAVYQDENYNNGKPVVGFWIVVDTEDGHDPISKFLKMGIPELIAPNEDCTGFKAINDKFTGFNDKCAGMYFLTSLRNNQYPGAMGKNVKKALIGLRAHFESEEIVSNNKSIGKDGKFSYTIVTKIYELPAHAQGGKETSRGKKASSKKADTMTETSSPDQIIEKAKKCLIKYLGENPEGILKSKLASMVTKDPDFEDDPDQMKIMTKIFQDVVLKAEDMPYVYDEESKMVKMAE